MPASSSQLQPSPHGAQQHACRAGTCSPTHVTHENKTKSSSQPPLHAHSPHCRHSTLRVPGQRAATCQQPTLLHALLWHEGTMQRHGARVGPEHAQHASSPLSLQLLK